MKETPVTSSFLGFGKKAACPSCGTTLAKRAGTSLVLCAVCGDYGWFAERTLRPYDPAAVEAAHLFAAPTPWTDMRAPTFSAVAHPLAALTDMILKKNEGVRLIEAKWPAGCCVCGKSASREETVARTVGFSASGSQREAIVVAKGIPHCAEHDEGVRIDRVVSFGDGGGSTLGLLFRSYASQRRFRQLNPWKWRG